MSISPISVYILNLTFFASGPLTVSWIEIASELAVASSRYTAQGITTSPAAISAAETVTLLPSLAYLESASE